MLPSLTELILLVVIILCIVGLGKIGPISEAIGAFRARNARGLPGDDAIDITPKHERSATDADGAVKPGRAEQPIDEAVVDDDTPDRNSET